jgi:hypothetical protein
LQPVALRTSSQCYVHLAQSSAISHFVVHQDKNL